MLARNTFQCQKVIFREISFLLQPAFHKYYLKMEDTIIKVRGKYEFILPYLISLLLSVTGLHFLIESREMAARTLFPALNMVLIGLSGTLLLIVFGLLSILFYSHTIKGPEHIHFNRRGFHSTKSFPHAVFIPWKELTDVKKAGFFWCQVY